ncbi:steroid 5-alpha reductase family enzyme [Haloactinomyces albus]|uniref:Steroid 5-alpha reductase family enzyme n=1 Tax=Haloactinomyces albus TaxID=1352928 RepID=A0AAE3ZBE0_9ACTN|nr:steroid 5-alpha reductase family enzyme [Haloactinomyces albus]
MLTALSPVLMTWLLAKGTGKPLLERGLRERRPAYADYIRRTSGFLPLPPKRV